MGTKNIPTIIMLTAGLITSIVMYINHYDLSTTLKIVLVVFFVFYIFGTLIRRMLDRFCFPKKEEEEAAEEENAESEEVQQSEDGSVIAKNNG